MSRLSEKTLELTICSQISYSINQLMVWFGLTQQQEARAGFDACTAVNGRLFVVQFKASSVTTSSGARRFIAPHGQMVKLQQLACGCRGVVFYALPLVGTTTELQAMPDVVNHTWLLDVADIPANMPPPTTRSGGVRKSGYHYIDVYPNGNLAIIRSDPVEVEIYLAGEMLKRLKDTKGLLSVNREAKDMILEFGRAMGRKFIGAYTA